MEEIIKELISRIEWVPTNLGATYYINLEVAIFVSYSGSIELIIFKDNAITEYTIELKVQSIQQIEEKINDAHKFFNL